MTPKYPFRVVVYSSTGGANNGQRAETHSYEVLAGAVAYRDSALRKPATRRVEIVLVLDEAVRHKNENHP